MTVIKQQDLIDSVADALQFISYYHPLDFVQAVHRAWERELNPAAKDAMAQILHQFENVRDGASAHLSGYWHRDGVYRDRYGGAVGSRVLVG